MDIYGLVVNNDRPLAAPVCWRTNGGNLNYNLNLKPVRRCRAGVVDVLVVSLTSPSVMLYVRLSRKRAITVTPTTAMAATLAATVVQLMPSK